MGKAKILKPLLREWQKELMEYRQSDKTKKEWCSEHVIPLSTFNGWLAREKKILKAAAEKVSENDCNSTVNKKAEIKSGWIKIEESNYFKEQTTPITIKIGGFAVLVEKNFDKIVFAEVLSSLKELC